MLLLPTGQVLFAAQTGDIYAYNYFGCIDSAARPQITAAPVTVRPFHSYTLHGRVLNGLSQAVGYGDDAAAATNYPLVRLRHLATGTVKVPPAPTTTPQWAWAPARPCTARTSWCRSACPPDRASSWWWPTG